MFPYNEKKSKCQKETMKRENFIFKNDAKKFYRDIRKEKVTVTETPAINDIERFWDTIWSGEKDFNEKAKWIRMYKLTMQIYKGNNGVKSVSKNCKQPLKSPINGSQ